MTTRPNATLSVLALAGLTLGIPAAAAAEDASVAARLEARGITKYEVDGDGDYKVTYNYSDQGRTQLVFVGGNTEAVGGLSIREVFSPAAHVEKDGINGSKALELLASSATMKIGSWEIRSDVLYFVIKILDDASAAELEAAMDVAAETADDMELELSGDRDDL